MTVYKRDSYKRNNRVALPRELLSAATYEIHSSLFITVASYYSHFAKRRNAASWGTRTTLAFNCHAHIWTRKKLLALLFPCSMNIHRVCSLSCYVTRVTSAGLASLVFVRTYIRGNNRRELCGFLLTRVPQQRRLFSVDYRRRNPCWRVYRVPRARKNGLLRRAVTNETYRNYWKGDYCLLIGLYSMMI